MPEDSGRSTLGLTLAKCVLISPVARLVFGISCASSIVRSVGRGGVGGNNSFKPTRTMTIKQNYSYVDSTPASGRKGGSATHLAVNTGKPT